MVQEDVDTGTTPLIEPKPFRYNPVSHGFTTADPEHPGQRLLRVEGQATWEDAQGKLLTFRPQDVARLAPGTYFTFEEPTVGYTVGKLSASTIICFRTLGNLEKEGLITPVVERIAPGKLAELMEKRHITLEHLPASPVPPIKPR